MNEFSSTKQFARDRRSTPFPCGSQAHRWLRAAWVPALAFVPALAASAVPPGPSAEWVGGTSSEDVQTRVELRFYEDGAPVVGPACVAGAGGAPWDGREGAREAAPSTLAPDCAPAARDRSRAGVQLSVVRDVGAFTRGLLEAAAAARGAPAPPPEASRCRARPLRCGQSISGRLAAGACGLGEPVAAELFELPLVSLQQLRLELSTASYDAQAVLTDPELVLREASWSDGYGAALEREVEQTGLWGVALTAPIAGGVVEGADYRLDVRCDGQAVGAAPPDGTYSGTHSDLGDMRIEVSNNAIQNYTFENYGCSFGTVTESFSGFSGGGCPIAANGTFSCGSVGCSPFLIKTRVQGQFSGNIVSGTYQDDSSPGGSPCCQASLLFNASLDGGGGGGQSAPTAPSGLEATALSQSAIELSWQDNSNNEDGFHIEQQAGSGPFLEVDSVPANTEQVTISGLDAGSSYTYRVRARNAAGSSPFSNDATATTLPAGQAGECEPSSTRLCLQQDRFAIEVSFRTTAGGPSESARGYEETSDSGLFYFFDPSNLEMLIKLLDGCAINNHYWVYFAATTDVELTLTVTDTSNGQVETYFNPLGQPANAVTDTSAFATCP